MQVSISAPEIAQAGVSTQAPPGVITAASFPDVLAAQAGHQTTPTAGASLPQKLTGRSATQALPIKQTTDGRALSLANANAQHTKATVSRLVRSGHAVNTLCAASSGQHTSATAVLPTHQELPVVPFSPAPSTLLSDLAAEQDSEAGSETLFSSLLVSEKTQTSEAQNRMVAVTSPSGKAAITTTDISAIVSAEAAAMNTATPTQTPLQVRVAFAQAPQVPVHAVTLPAPSENTSTEVAGVVGMAHEPTKTDTAQSTHLPQDVEKAVSTAHVAPIVERPGFISASHLVNTFKASAEGAIAQRQAQVTTPVSDQVSGPVSPPMEQQPFPSALPKTQEMALTSTLMPLTVPDATAQGVGAQVVQQPVRQTSSQTSSFTGGSGENILGRKRSHLPAGTIPAFTQADLRASGNAGSTEETGSQRAFAAEAAPGMNASSYGLQPQTTQAPLTQHDNHASTPASAFTQGSTSTETQPPNITDARLVQHLSGLAMQVHLQSEDFGRVSVQTTYGRDTLATHIVLDNSPLGAALGTALMPHVVAMEQKLGQEHGLQASVSIDTRAGSASSQHHQDHQDSQNRGGRDTDESSSRRSSTLVNAPALPHSGLSGHSGGVLSSLSPFGSGRLDIRI